ncbi:Predicted small metal-binding protein [Andreprevotia lacus DSM 23236]|jgi:predicted small metal-binding protein|uniref:Predicted small metal-binding protein n=1 Tax=Andreprevotia lacus DSM 23236 TaxID=1121001 RepID=A0A1W1XKJ7_9NEIS|nr:DUF1059 domain-containing protein [Andreprevotia lacus]SMC24362.1 Predicted small metal-binding protein [Andreprevotia lacus DSM 23236]
MNRLYIDCRDVPGSTCSVAITADNKEELLVAAVEHAVKAHGYTDTPELRAQLQTMFKVAPTVPQRKAA